MNPGVHREKHFEFLIHGLKFCFNNSSVGKGEDPMPIYSIFHFVRPILKVWVQAVVVVAICTSAVVSDAGVNKWTPLTDGISGGLIKTVTIDPSHPNIMFAGTWGAGIFKTTDGGENWKAVNQGITNRYITKLIVSPVSSNTVYAGTTSNGIFKTMDGGENWTHFPIGESWSGGAIKDLVMSEADPEILYAKGTYFVIADNGVPYLYIDNKSLLFKTENGGASWTLISFGDSDPEITAFALCPVNPNTAYAGTKSNGILKSIDGGVTWNSISNGISEVDIGALSIHPENPDLIWAGAAAELFKSTNGGANWTAVSNLNSKIELLLLDPSNPLTLFASVSMGDLYKTTDGGNSWLLVGSNTIDSTIEALAIDPSDTDAVYAGSLKGLFKTFDGGLNWIPRNHGITNVEVLQIAINPENPDMMYAGTAGYGIFKTENRGASWVPVNNGLTDFVIYALAISPSSPNTIFLGTREGIFKTKDAGAQWTAVNDGINLPYIHIQSIAVDPIDPDVVYAGNRYEWNTGSIFKTTDGGTNWVELQTGIQPDSIKSISVAFTQPETVYAGTWGSGVIKSTDAGANWVAIGPDSPHDYIETISVHPADSNKLYIGSGIPVIRDYGGGNYNNAGNGWDEITAARALYFYDVVTINPQYPEIAYAASSKGFFKTVTGGGTWGLVLKGETGLPFGMSLQALASDGSDPNTLYAGTNQGGVWTFTDVPASGDLNADTFINLTDAIIALHLSAGGSMEPLNNGDLTGDGRIGVEDAIAILRKTAEL